VEISPGLVDVTGSAARVRVRIDARDATSGVQDVQLSLSREGASVFAKHQVDLRRVAGTPRAGRWKGHLDLPQGTRRGWWVAEVTVGDRTQLWRSYHSKLRATRPPGLRAVRVVSIRAWLPPEVTTTRTSARVIDIRTAPATVVIEARIRDAGSGVATAAAWILRGLIYEYEVPLRLISGTRNDGLWRGSWTATTCQVLPEVRTVRVAATDRASNRGVPGPAEPSLEVQNDDHAGPWIPNRELTSTTASLTFSEDVYGITEASAQLFDYAAAAGSPALSGQWRCENHTGVLVDCQTGPVRTARFLPDAPFPARYLGLIINPEHVLDVTDGAGNPYLQANSSIGVPPK
jgi:hypothetical protein